MAARSGKPLVLLPACNLQQQGLPLHGVFRQYTDAVRLAGALPLLVPNLDPADIDGLLDSVHGVLLTGSPSNVQPSHFGEAVRDPTLPLDEERDAWVLPLVPRVLARGMPLFAICRGAQEVNVALGGSLHQAVQDVPGHADHRDNPAAPTAVQWGPAHPVQVMAGGLLQRIVGRPSFTVNSLHGQGVHRLAAGLRVEALAPDGLVEAFSAPDTPGFALGVQWHPEWQAADNPVSLQLLRAFGQAVVAYRAANRGAGTSTHSG